MFVWLGTASLLPHNPEAAAVASVALVSTGIFHAAICSIPGIFDQISAHCIEKYAIIIITVHLLLYVYTYLHLYSHNFVHYCLFLVIKTFINIFFVIFFRFLLGVPDLLKRLAAGK
jgi:hypothetical protein